MQYFLFLFPFMNKLSNFYLYLNIFYFFGAFLFLKPGYLLKVLTYFSVGKYKTIPCHIFCVHMFQILFIFLISSQRGDGLIFPGWFVQTSLYESHFLIWIKCTCNNVIYFLLFNFCVYGICWKWDLEEIVIVECTLNFSALLIE